MRVKRELRYINTTWSRYVHPQQGRRRETPGRLVNRRQGSASEAQRKERCRDVKSITESGEALRRYGVQNWRR